MLKFSKEIFVTEKVKKKLCRGRICVKEELNV